MNIFVLDYDPRTCAEYHCDKHVIKMTLETAQILCTVRHKFVDKKMDEIQEMDEHIKDCMDCAIRASETGWDLEEEIAKMLDIKGEIPYKKTHENHPSVLWACESVANYIWLCTLGKELAKQYEIRYKKVHKCLSVIEDSLDSLPIIGGGFRGLFGTKFALAMPEEYQVDDVVESYRKYYIGDKKDIATWKTETPKWFSDGVEKVQ